MAEREIAWEEIDEGVWLGEGPERGPTVGITVGVHGHETAGGIVADDILQGRLPLQLDRGRVYLIKANPKAMRAGIKQTEDFNMNRGFRPLTPAEKAQNPADLPYELRRAQQLLQYLGRSQALLDLHESTNHMAHPFIIAERNAFMTAIAIGAPVISSGWGKDKAEMGGTDDYMHRKGTEGICYELGWVGEPAANASLGHQVVRRYLGAQGLIDQQPEPLFADVAEPRFIDVDYAVIRNHDHWRLGDPGFQTFDRVRQGELIVEHGDDRHIAHESAVVMFPYPNPSKGSEGVVVGTELDAKQVLLELTAG